MGFLRDGKRSGANDAAIPLTTGNDHFRELRPYLTGSPRRPKRTPLLDMPGTPVPRKPSATTNNPRESLPEGDFVSFLISRAVCS